MIEIIEISFYYIGGYLLFCCFFWVIIRNDDDIKNQSFAIKRNMFLKMPIYFLNDMLQLILRKNK